MSFQNEQETTPLGDLAGLGTSMKQYARAQWIEMGGIVALVFISSTIMVGSFMNEDPNETFGVEVGIWVLIGGMIAFEIYVLIRYFQMYFQLKTVGEITNTLQLQKSATFLLVAAVSSVFLRLFAEIFGGGSINALLALDFTGMTPEEMLIAMDSIVVATDTTLLLILSYIPLIFQIFFAMAFHKWAQALHAEHHGDFLYAAVEQSSNLIRIGVGLMFIPYIEILGALVLLVGYGKTGKAILIISPNHRSTVHEPRPNAGYTPFDTRPPTLTIPIGSDLFTTSNSQHQSRGSRNLCSYCGTKLPNPDAKFCSMCGHDLK